MMKALEEYISIIHYRQQSFLADSEYGEVHHIIPKSCGGGNAEWNLVKLTPEEHYRVHELLPFIYTEGKEHKAMIYAWSFLARTRDGVEVSEEEYGVLKRELASAAAERAKGNHYHLGAHHTEEARRKMSEANKGKHLSEEHKRKISEANKGKLKSEDTRRKLSEANKGKPSHNKGIPMSEEQKHKISEAKKGKPKSEEAKRKMSEAHKGKPLSEETKRKMSEARKLYWENKRKEKVA